MFTLVRKTLEVYIQERRVITQSEFPSNVISYINTKESVFVTLYYEGKIIASSGRIQCKKDNTAFECIDNTLLCLKDPRFGAQLQNPDILSKIHIRTDRFSLKNRRLLRNIQELDITKEGIIFLSENYKVLSVILPHMIRVHSSPETYLELACKKAGVDQKKLTNADYVIYAIKTESESDFS